MKGSPVNPSGQWQIGLRFATVQRAPKPHEPTQGFMHFWLLQLSFGGQSELTTHSGRQIGGFPK